MSTLSQNERKALNDIFLGMTKKETFFSRLQAKKSDLKHFIKLLFMRQKRRLKHPVR